jgi:hypothetical protein
MLGRKESENPKNRLLENLGNQCSRLQHAMSFAESLYKYGILRRHKRNTSLIAGGSQLLAVSCPFTIYRSNS